MIRKRALRRWPANMENKNMARIAFEKIMAGLEDALAYADGESSRGTKHRVKVADVDITHLREKLGLSQDRFAALFGLST
jgi:putative transcriptional regulator